MEFETTAEWNEGVWSKAEPVYHEAFPEHGRKNRTIIRRMFERRLVTLHTMSDRSEVVGMALTGNNRNAEALIIDYIAVREDRRGGGLGRQLLDYIKSWSQTKEPYRGIIIEVEADPSAENAERIRFWERCGFQLTDYVHHYIWVPEPYRAMYCSFRADAPLPHDGETLFRYITEYHKEAYRR